MSRTSNKEAEMKIESNTRLTLSILLIAAVAIPLAAQEAKDAELPTVDQVLERYIEAVGGREAIEKLNTRVCKLEATHDLNWKDPKIQVIQIEAFAKDPYLVLWKEHKPSGIRLEGYDGKDFWHSERGETVVRDKPIPLKHRFIFDPKGPLSIEYYFPNLSVLSIETVDDRKCYVLQPKELKEAHFTLYFDIETGLLIKIGHYWNMDDYREVDGVKVPFKITMSRKGGSSTYLFESIEHNAPLEDSLFDVPANDNN